MAAEESFVHVVFGSWGKDVDLNEVIQVVLELAANFTHNEGRVVLGTQNHPSSANAAQVERVIVGGRLKASLVE